MITNEEFLRDPMSGMMILIQVKKIFPLFFYLHIDNIPKQHVDLLNMLRDLALQEGVEIRQNANVIRADANSVSVRLETGDIISGDIIVLADGCSSKLRSSVTGFCQDLPLEAAPRLLFAAFAVDISLLKDDESYRGILEPTSVRFYLFRSHILHPSKHSF